MLDNTEYILGSCNSDTAHIDFFNNLGRFTNKNSYSVTINHVVKSWPDTKPINKQALEEGRTLQQVADLMLFTQRWFVNLGGEDENVKLKLSNKNIIALTLQNIDTVVCTQSLNWRWFQV